MKKWDLPNPPPYHRMSVTNHSTTPSLASYKTTN